MIPKIETMSDVEALFPKTPTQVDDLVKKALHDAEHDLNGLFSIQKAQRTFDNTVRSLDTIGALFQMRVTILHVLEMLSPEKELRDAAHEAIIKLNDFAVENFAQNIKLYRAFKDYSDAADLSLLDDEQRYTITESLEGFKRSGLHLDEKIQQQLRETKKLLGVHELNFDRNIATDNRTIAVSKAELAGLEDDFINNLKRTDDGNYLLGVDYPTYYYVLENATNETVRKNLWKEFVNRGYPANETELAQVIALRDKIAALVGFKSYAALDIDAEMAKTPETVQAFLDQLIERSNKKAEQELKTLRADLPQGITLQQGKIKPWDNSFLHNYYKKKYLAVDEVKLSDYFPLEHTLEILFELYEEFFGLEFESSPTTNLWSHEVTALKVLRNKQFIGYILLDLFPRPNKYSHACEITIVPTLQATQFYPAVITVVANFPRATADKPALLKRDDVITFFHEFGHAIHAILGTTELATNSGANVKRDFVEMPSQMLEEWMWQPEMLKRVSQHYKTGQPLPDEEIERIVKLKNYSSGEQTLKQIFYALVSLEAFKEGERKDMYELTKKIYQQVIRHILFDPEYRFYNNFGHLTGYGAKYYGYLWSKVYALDLFDTIKRQQFSKEIADRYITKVIGKGGSADPMDLLIDFLGRAPQSEAFFKDLGL